MKIFLIIINTIFSLAVFVWMVCDYMLGINNHDVYYLVLTIIDYKILQLSIENLIKSIQDAIDNV